MARLSGLTIGALPLTPTFDADEFDYAAETSSAADDVAATPDTGWGVVVTVNDAAHENGEAATWYTGLNAVRAVLTDLGVPVSPEVAYEVEVTKTGVLGALTVASEAGEAEGFTAISVTESATAGLSYVYKTAASVTAPALDDDLAEWAAWDGTDEIEATTGHDIVIAEVLAIGDVLYAKKVGGATVTANAGT